MLHFILFGWFNHLHIHFLIFISQLIRFKMIIYQHNCVPVNIQLIHYRSVIQAFIRQLFLWQDRITRVASQAIPTLPRRMILFIRIIFQCLIHICFLKMMFIRSHNKLLQADNIRITVFNIHYNRVWTILRMFFILIKRHHIIWQQLKSIFGNIFCRKVNRNIRPYRTDANDKCQ